MSRLGKIAAIACGLLLLGSTPQARAETTKSVPFGTPGQWLLGGGVGVTYDSRFWKQSPADSAQVELSSVNQLSIWLAPRAMTFIARDLALGASLELGYDHVSPTGYFSGNAFSLGGSLIAAYRVTLGERLFWFPELSLGAVYEDRSVDAQGRQNPLASRALRYDPWLADDQLRLQLTLALPFALSPAPNFFVGFGPCVRAQYATTSTLTRSGASWLATLGLCSALGTWQ